MVKLTFYDIYFKSGLLIISCVHASDAGIIGNVGKFFMKNLEQVSRASITCIMFHFAINCLLTVTLQVYCVSLCGLTISINLLGRGQQLHAM